MSLCLLLFSVAGTFAQSVLNASHLAYVKQHLSAPTYAQAYQALRKQAGHDLQMKPVSVMDKNYIPSSGSKHDYVSLARYAWPDPTRKTEYLIYRKMAFPTLSLISLTAIACRRWLMPYIACRWLITSLGKNNMPRRQPNSCAPGLSTRIPR